MRSHSQTESLRRLKHTFGLRHAESATLAKDIYEICKFLACGGRKHVIANEIHISVSSLLKFRGNDMCAK